MTFKNSRAKLVQKVMGWPDSRAHKQAPGMGMTWWELAVRLVREKKIGKVRKLVRRAEEAGLID